MSFEDFNSYIISMLLLICLNMKLHILKICSLSEAVKNEPVRPQGY